MALSASNDALQIANEENLSIPVRLSFYLRSALCLVLALTRRLSLDSRDFRGAHVSHLF